MCNLTDHQQSLLIGQEYEIRKKKERGGGDRKSIHAVRCDGENQSGQIDHIDSTAKVAKEIAKEMSYMPEQWLLL